MEDEYMETQDISEVNRSGTECNDSGVEAPKDFGDNSGYDEVYDDDEGGNNFRGGNRGRGNFSRGRGRGPPPGWGSGPPMRFRGRGYGPGGPPMRARGFFRGRGGPRFGPNNGPNFDNNWGPMGPPPPGMMGGPPPFGPPPGMMPPGGPMGPPPNMMGQPPFGGPPGMPPNMPGPELWVETKSEDGKSYYYHSRTRETTWTRPTEGPTVKVITQAEMEAMATTGQLPGMGGPQQMGMVGGMGGPMQMMGNGMPMGGMPGALPPFMTQPPPWLKDANKEKPTEIDSPEQIEDMPPGAGEMPPNSLPNTLHPPPQAHNMVGFPSGPPPTGAPLFPGPGAGPGGPGGPGGPPSGGAFPWPGGWGGWPPAQGQQPPQRANNMPQPGGAASLGGLPPNMGAVGNLPTMGAMGNMGALHNMGNEPDIAPVQEQPPMQMPPKQETVIPEELAARASEWTTHRAPDGRPYYYRAQNQESVWEKPEPLRDLEKLQAKIAEEKGEKLPEHRRRKEMVEAKVIGEVIDVEAHAEAVAAAEAERQAEAERRAQQERERLERERQERERSERDAAEKERLEKEKAKQDKSRPISSTPISGTPWCVVWTGDGRVFFYNPTAHSSVWERPAQLLGRADVDRAVSQPPPAIAQQTRVEAAGAGAAGSAAGASGSGGAGGAGGAKPANGQLKRSADSSSDESDSEPKRAKQDDKKPAAASGKIDAGKEAAIEAEVRAARERALVPLEQRMRAFRAMLEHNDVSAFSTWEKELHKIVFDPRYLLLTSKERKQVFDKYVRERAEEERKEKKNRLLAKKQAFRALMEEAKLHSKSSYTEFSSRHGRDERFKAIEKARDRETFFNEYIADLRKRDKEDKDRKRDQAKTDFIAMLKEKTVDRHLRWAEVKKKVDTDPRYKAVEGSALKEDYYREYCKILKEERKKEKDAKDKDRERNGGKKEKKEKERDKDGKEKKKEKSGDKPETSAEEDKKQPTPPPDQWAEILGIPEEEKAKRKAEAEAEKNVSSDEKDEVLHSPKQLRSSKKEVEKKVKSPPKKRKEEFKSPEAEKKVTEKRKRKKSEKD